MSNVFIPSDPLCWPLLPVPNANGQLEFPTLATSVRQLIEVVLSTRPGEQLMRPSYGGGLENMLNEPNTVTTRKRMHDLIEESLGRWEPRIDVDSIGVDPVDGEPGTVRVELAYRIKRTQLSQRVGMTVVLQPGANN